jgi:HNH endonuclease
MRIEIILFLITGAIVANIYTEGKYLKKLYTFKKYYQMIGVVFGALMLYWLIKKDPKNARNILATSNEYLKYMPIDKNSSAMLSPILDFTTKHPFAGGDLGGSYGQPILAIPTPEEKMAARMLDSGKKGTKRSVSETKKKFVASRQNWKCGDCQQQLNAWFEVDHKIRLEYGGSNHIDNLVAMCRECHGKKTTIENL